MGGRDIGSSLESALGIPTEIREVPPSVGDLYGRYDTNDVPCKFLLLHAAFVSDTVRPFMREPACVTRYSAAVAVHAAGPPVTGPGSKQVGKSMRDFGRKLNPSV